MKLKSRDKTKAGDCRAVDCKDSPVAIADGRTFFSKRGPKEAKLCEDHLLEAQEMAQEMGGELVWEELVEPTPSEPAPRAAAEVVPIQRAEDDLKVELQDETSQAAEALTQITDFEITDNDSMTFAADVLAETKGNWKRLDDKRKEITQPINIALKAANDLFRPALEFYKKCEAGIKGKMLAANQRAQVAAQEALQAASDAAAEGDTEAVTTAIVAHDTAVTLPAADGVQYRSTWKFRITDESLIPREFLAPDHKLIEGHVRHKKGSTTIPGIEVFEDVSVASASK